MSNNKYLVKIAELLDKEAALASAFSGAINATRAFGRKVMGGNMPALRETQSRIIGDVRKNTGLSRRLSRSSLKDHHRAMRTEAGTVRKARMQLAGGAAIGAAGFAAGSSSSGRND